MKKVWLATCDDFYDVGDPLFVCFSKKAAYAECRKRGYKWDSAYKKFISREWGEGEAIAIHEVEVIEPDK